MTAMPKSVLVMRHAEKPDDVRDPNLSAVGYERAKELATYIPGKGWTPDVIFAAAISKHSARPYETVEPLAKATSKPIDATIADQDYEVLASDLLSTGEYGGKLILVCWHHGHIPSLLRALGAPSGQYPDPWKPTVFNLIVTLDFSAGGQPVVSQTTELL